MKDCGKNKLIILVGLFILAITLRIWNINKMGRTWDEYDYVEKGYKIIELLKKGDINNSYFYTTYDHSPLVYYFYGISARFDIDKYLPDGRVVLKYDLTHSRLLSGAIYSLGVVITALAGWSMVSPVVGIIAGIILAMLPFSLGLSQLVTAESFKIFIYPLTFYSYILLLKKYSPKKLFLSGILTGIAIQIKESNLLLLPLYCLMYLLYYKQNRQKDKLRLINKKSFSILWISIISVLVFILLMPQLPLNLSEFYQAQKFRREVQFSPKIWQITLSVPEVFLGRIMLTPNFYYIVYFLISIPVLILLLFFIGIKNIYERKNWILYSLILWFATPFLMSFYSWRQHGLRYIIEIYPAIALISAIGFNTLSNKIVKKEFTKILYFIPVALYLFIALWNIKPYYLDYFNEIVGGTNTVYKYKLFQQGWWGQGLREAGLFIKQVAPKGSKIGYALSPSHVLPRFEGFKYEEWSENKNYDYVIVNHYNLIREGFNDDPIRKNYKLIHEVRANRATLVYIYQKK